MLHEPPSAAPSIRGGPVLLCPTSRGEISQNFFLALFRKAAYNHPNGGCLAKNAET
jgi:hypothetical protein